MAIARLAKFRSDLERGKRRGLTDQQIAARLAQAAHLAGCLAPVAALDLRVKSLVADEGDDPAAFSVGIDYRCLACGSDSPITAGRADLEAECHCCACGQLFGTVAQVGALARALGQEELIARQIKNRATVARLASTWART